MWRMVLQIDSEQFNNRSELHINEEILNAVSKRIISRKSSNALESTDNATERWRDYWRII